MNRIEMELTRAMNIEDPYKRLDILNQALITIPRTAENAAAWDNAYAVKSATFAQCYTVRGV